MNLEILYLAWNRLAMTQMSFRTLLQNTDWRYVSRLVVYDDGSTDGTAEWLVEAGKRIPVPAFEFRQVSYNAPPATMNDYLALTEADAFVKLDNDIAVPSKWLDVLIRLAAEYGEFELIGMEAGQNSPPKPLRIPRSVLGARHIGGVGLMRVEAFRNRLPIPSSIGRDGFTIFQHRQRLAAGWVVPDLRVIQLDRIPDEPWASLSEQYIERGWQRRWHTYDEDGRYWWEWLPVDDAAKWWEKLQSEAAAA